MSDRPPLVVLHVIVDLNEGGAEAVLYRVVTAASATVRAIVVSLTDRGLYGGFLERAGVEVHSLGMPAGRASVSGFLGLCRLIRRARPDVVQTWMYHSDLIGGLAARMAGCRRVAWGLHNTTLDRRGSTMSVRLARRLCAALSHAIPRAIASCSERGVSVHRALGYANRFTVIPNGCDTSLFAPDRNARARIRSEWGVAPHVPLVGFVGRWAPQKDHATFLRAAALEQARRPDVRWVLTGRGCDSDNADLSALLADLGLAGSIILTGSRQDIPDIMNAFDLHVLSSSFGEALPNVVAEAMACGTPCVVTDVGDAASMVGDVGWVVPPRDHRALAGAIDAALIALGDESCWAARRHACRRRVIERYGLDAMVDGYEQLWSRIAAPFGA